MTVEATPVPVPAPVPSSAVPIEADSADAWGFVPSAPVAGTALTVAAAARELGTIQAMVQAAQTRPRDEYQVVQRIALACQRPALAEKAEYKFHRKGMDKPVTGPSATFARFLASVWGNLRYAIDIVEDTPEHRHLRGWAHELQSNAMASFEHTFSKKVQRRNRKTGVAEWIATDDEREIREATARWGALLVRNAILCLLPPDVVDKAVKSCQKTRQLVAAKQLKENRADVTHRLMFGFGQVGVTPDLVEKFLEHKLETITAEELSVLQQILTSIEEGQSSRDDFFEIRATVSTEGQGVVDALRSRAEAGASVPSPAGTAPAVKSDPPAAEWITMAQTQAIQAAIAEGKIGEPHLHEYRKRCGLGKGNKMSGVQADEFLRMIHDGRAHTLVDDGVPRAR